MPLKKPCHICRCNNVIKSLIVYALFPLPSACLHVCLQRGPAPPQRHAALQAAVLQLRVGQPHVLGHQGQSQLFATEPTGLATLQLPQLGVSLLLVVSEIKTIVLIV